MKDVVYIVYNQYEEEIVSIYGYEPAAYKHAAILNESDRQEIRKILPIYIVKTVPVRYEYSPNYMLEEDNYGH